MSWLTAFGRFWYDFVVGDDWTIAIVVVAAVGLTAALAHNGFNAWLVLPLCVFGGLAASLWRALRTHQSSGQK
jgi:type IV secretory pathway VirB2 component (pilin)